MNGKDGINEKDKIEIVQKQIDHLRKEVEDRVSSNNTLWRAVMAAVAGLLLLKQDLNMRLLLYVAFPLFLIMVSHWLNQMYTIYRAGAAMADVENKINLIAGQSLLEYETNLAAARGKRVGSWRLAFVPVGVLASTAYWLLFLLLVRKEPVAVLSSLREIAYGATGLANLLVLAHLVRFTRLVSLPPFVLKVEGDEPIGIQQGTSTVRSKRK
ncbi:MAG TPA: hypothetical protein VHC97_24695 [Thermoanaerobaculia bacterium]|jgi:hypothetical protein|nr:hypothetical protein [Thermoanaerobaculia bacterium]